MTQSEETKKALEALNRYSNAMSRYKPYAPREYYDSFADYSLIREFIERAALSQSPQGDTARKVDAPRSTTLFDVNGLEIFEGDIIETPMTDKPYSKGKKEKHIRGIVKWRPADISKTVSGHVINQPPQWWVDFSIDPDYGKFIHGHWSNFFMCRKVTPAPASDDGVK